MYNMFHYAKENKINTFSHIYFPFNACDLRVIIKNAKGMKSELVFIVPGTLYTLSIEPLYIHHLLNPKQQLCKATVMTSILQIR